MKRILPIILLLIPLLSPSTLSAQGLPQGYFRNPLDMDIGLSATFAELRAGHFHAGIDIRTGGVENKPVYAAADGYVAKVSISPWGGGKILYIKHPNGYTTVYMHLNGYAGEIGKAVEREQYARQSYSIAKLFEPGELPVKKGQLVAYSGNTGGSGGPHLHFEVRRGGAEDLHTHATTINPLHFGLPYRDGIRPVIRGVRVYPDGGTPVDVGADNAVNVSSPFYLGVYATDAAEGSTAKNGIDHMEIRLDGELVFRYTTRELPLDSSRMDNALIDYSLYTRLRQAYLLTRALPGAEGPWIPLRAGDGIFRLRPGSTHRIGIKVYDVRNNCAERTLTVTVGEGTGVEGAKAEASGQAVSYDKPFTFSLPPYAFSLPLHTLYADDRLDIRAAGPRSVSIAPTVNDIPPHLYYTISIEGQLPGVPASRVVVARVTRKSGSEKLTAYKTTHRGDVHTAQVRDWGEFTLAADTTAPTVRPLNFSESKPLKTTVLKIKIGDNLAGVETYNCRLNGSWILAEYDGKTATLTVNAGGKLRPGRNTLACDVIDGAGNHTTMQWTLTR